MDNLKEKEQKLLESLVRLDTITDLVVGSKKKIVDLEEVKSQLENNLKLNIQFIANDGDKINFSNKYYSLKKKFDGMRKQQIENNAKV